MVMNPQNDASLKNEAPSAVTPERHCALLAALVESTDDAVVSKDLDGIILTWNNAAARIFGYSAQEIIGKSVRVLIPDDLQHEEEVILEKIRAGERICHYETLRLRKNGEQFHVSITISPLINEEGKIIGASKIARDISERKQLEKQLIQSEKLAATGRMAATVAHEINNPLDSVLNLLYLAHKSDSLQEIRAFLSMAESELEHVAQIARQALGYYRDDGTPTLVDIQSLIEHVLAVYHGKLVSAGIATECQFEKLPRLLASRGELLQIFSNIVANAIDVMSRGGKFRIHIKRCFQPDEIEIQFADNGVGIRNDDLDKVFEPFFTTKGNIGTGIGLWVVKQLVEKRGGRIGITSSTNTGTSGTTISIFLPLTVSEISQHKTVN